MIHKVYSTRLLKTSILFTIALAWLMPASVFAQEGATTNNDGVEATSVEASAPVGYTTEFITGDTVVGDFVVGPGKTEMTLNPGDSGEVELIVTNRTGELKQFNFEIEDVTGSASGATSVILLGDDVGPYTLKDYIELPQMSIDLEHNERARIPVKVKIPLDAEPGGRYGSVLVTTVTRDAEITGIGGAAPQSALISRIGTLFFVIIDGDLDVSGSLQDFAAIPAKQFFSEGPIQFGIYFENTGSVHLNPYGILRVSNFLGEEVGYMEIEPWFALPKSLRFREVEWGRGLLFGKYTATIELNRGYDDVVDEAEYSFWVVPWMFIAAGLLIIFVVLFIGRAFFRRFELKRKGD